MYNVIRQCTYYIGKILSDKSTTIIKNINKVYYFLLKNNYIKNYKNQINLYIQK